MFLDKISISPEVKAVNLSLALSGVNLTLFASPSTAAATALHTSTSTPVQFPAASALENHLVLHLQVISKADFLRVLI